MPETKVAVTLGDMIDGGAILQPDEWLYVQQWFIARRGLNQPPEQVEAPNGTYRLVRSHGNGYLYEPAKKEDKHEQSDR